MKSIIYKHIQYNLVFISQIVKYSYKTFLYGTSYEERNLKNELEPHNHHITHLPPPTPQNNNKWTTLKSGD